MPSPPHPRPAVTRRPHRWLDPQGCRLAGLLACAALGLTGCQVIPEAQPDPTRYFVLSAPPSTEAPATNPSGIVVGLHSVELPAYLRNSRSLLVARGDNELIYREYDRWAEPLAAGLERVFREALAAHERVGRVDPFPFATDVARDLELTLRVRRCEGAETGDGRKVARLAVAYDISRPGAGGELLKQGVYEAPEAAWDGEAASLAALLGGAAARAAQAIAAELP